MFSNYAIRATCPQVGITKIDKRCIFHWINKMFNLVDEDRIRTVGPDRACAEWLLKNGAAVKWYGEKEKLTDYNLLPPENIKLRISEIDATDSSIMHYGFDNLKGCKYIEKIVLHKCSYLEDEALPMLAVVNNTLKHLQVSSCWNITDNGLKGLENLTKLQSMLIFDLPYVVKKTETEASLKKALPNCDITFRIGALEQ